MATLYVQNVADNLYLDLCEYHMRKHYVPACRLKPVEREPSTQDRTWESLDRIGKKLDDWERRRGKKAG